MCIHGNLGRISFWHKKKRSDECPTKKVFFFFYNVLGRAGKVGEGGKLNFLKLGQVGYHFHVFCNAELNDTICKLQQVL